MAISFIENDALRVGVATHYGARVVNLIDKATGRDWVTQGGESTQTGEDARYSSPEAVAWDECFPTVSAWDASATGWGRRLRDHGDLWGRPFSVEALSETALTTSLTTHQFRFTRALTLNGPRLTADYSVVNLSDKPLPYLWALHALLAVTPPDRIVIPGLAKVKGSYVSVGGKQIEARELSWPDTNGKVPFRLDEVQPRSSNIAVKFLADGSGGSASVGHPGQWLEIAWDSSIKDIGLWYTYGGWPQAGGHQEIAIEPTTSEADHLGQAIDKGFVPLKPGEQRNWQVTLTVKH